MKQHLYSPTQFGFTFEDIYFTSADGLKLHGWWLAAKQKPKATIIFLHGNGQNISTHFTAISWLTRFNYNVFIFDYRGYGLSQGIPVLEGVINDIFYAFDYVIQRKAVNSPLFVVAQSLGASMGIYALSQKPAGIDGAIFISPFSDYHDITQIMLAKSWLSWAFQWPLSFTVNNDYRPLNFAPALPAIPILYIYSQQDEIIPPQQVRALFKKTHKPVFIEQTEGSHNSILAIKTNQHLLLTYLDSWVIRQSSHAN